MISWKLFTLRYHELRKVFLTEKTRNYLRRIEFKDGLTVDITVYYCSKKYINRGVYKNSKDLLLAFECFTDQELLKDEWDKVLIPKVSHPERANRGKKLQEFKKRTKVPPQKKSLKLVNNLGSKK